MEIEVWSDVVCPWCYIGKRRLEQALAAQGLSDHDSPVRVIHRAFQLDPQAMSEGQRTIDVLASKYQVSPQQAEAMMANVTEVAEGVGLTYHLLQTISGNTKDAHRLLLWAQDQGHAQDLLEALYAGYFTDGLPIFTETELMAFVVKAGLEATDAQVLLASDAYAAEVQADQELAADFGATGVPFFVFDRRYGISGAQPLEVFRETLAKAMEES